MTGSMARRIVALAVALVAIAAVVFVVIGRGSNERHLTADFPSTISLYKGADVEILGVSVGKVTGIHVVGDQVAVSMVYGSSHALPADVHAVIVPPSIVGDRYVELTPAYTGGPTLANDAVLHQPSTAVPVEIDQIYASLNQLSAALGPNGANAKGALSQLLSVLADNLRGNGAALHTTLHGLSAAVSTLAASRENIASSVTNLSQFSKTLAGDDPQVRTLAQLLATVSTQLNGQDSDLSHATGDLNVALREVAHFVAHNRAALTANVSDLASITKTIVSHKRDVAAALDLAPLGLTDLWDSYVPENWDLAHPVGVNINGMTTATTARGNLFEDLGDQLGSSLTALCANLPPSATKKISALCNALATTPGGLNGILGQLANLSANNQLPGTKNSTVAGLLLGQAR
jgi:phospholipid/cholesterol/gamma-HCH transport system substrate-binding protein